MYSELADLHLVGKYKNGDPLALNELFERYKKDLMRFVNSLIRSKVDSEDVVQDVVVKVIEGINNDKHLNFKKKANIKAWIMSIAYTESMLYYRKSKSSIVATEYDENMLDIATTEVPKSERPEILIEELLLSPKLSCLERSILELRYRENKTFPEIAAMLNEPEALVQRIYYDSTATLRKEYKKSSL